MTLIEHAAPETGVREHHSVSVVVPVRGSTRELMEHLEQLPALVDEVVLVDGRSTDGAIEAVRVIRPDVRVVFDVAVDDGRSLQSGFAAARGDCVVALSAEVPVDPADIARFVAALQAGGARWPQAT
jgi:hypothetical protein